MNGAQPAVELNGVERRYGERLALAGATVTLPRGATLAVLGPNGAGKTTLLRVLAGLLRPHGGTARVLGCVLPDEAWRVRARIGYLGHDPLLYRELTGRENLVYHARLHGLIGGRRSRREGTRNHLGGDHPGPAERSSPPGQQDRSVGAGTSADQRAGAGTGRDRGAGPGDGLARIDEQLAAVGMDHRADGPVRELSKGMVQRLAVARATLHDPELLLLDEPRANLDPAAAEALEPLIGRASGRTRVLVTHDVDGALAEADLALGLRGGRQAFCRPAAEVDPAEARELYT